MLADWTQHDLLVDGVQIHYARTGQGDKPPLLCIHGFSDNGLCWTPVARALESNYDLIMPDMRGHGLSERVQPGEKIDMAADVAGLIRALGLTRPIVAGHSMGAMVTYQLGRRFPDLASALILEDPPWWIAPAHPLPADEATEPPTNPVVQWAKSLAGQSLEDLLTQYRAEHPTWPEALVRPMAESKKQLDQTVVDILAGTMRSQEGNWLATLHNITQPLLLIAGEPQLGGIVTPAVVAKARALNPKVTTVIIPDVGHLIRFDKYTAFMEAMRSFLKQIEA